MTRCRRIGGPGALEGRCLQRPGSRKRLPSKDFHADDDQMKILAKLRDLRCQQCKGNKDCSETSVSGMSIRTVLGKHLIPIASACIPLVSSKNPPP